jgi:hypothetical protein
MAMQRGLVRRGAGGRIAGTVGLTDKQAAFIMAYSRNGGNATAAAVAAGYSMPAQRSYELMHNPAVAAAVDHLVRDNMRTLATKASMLLERFLDRAIEEIEADPAAALKLPVKELRALLASTTDKLLPPPREEAAPRDTAADAAIQCAREVCGPDPRRCLWAAVAWERQAAGGVRKQGPWRGFCPAV